MITKTNIAHLSLLSIPVVILGIFGFFLIPEQADFIRELCNSILVTSFLYGLCFLLPSTRLKAIVSFSIGILVCLLLLVKLSFYHNYQAKLSASALFVIFETNAQETTGFLEVYLNKTILLLSVALVIYLVIYAVMLFKEKAVFELELKKRNQLIFKIGFLILAVVSGTL